MSWKEIIRRNSAPTKMYSVCLYVCFNQFSKGRMHVNWENWLRRDLGSKNGKIKTSDISTYTCGKTSNAHCTIYASVHVRVDKWEQLLSILSKYYYRSRSSNGTLEQIELANQPVYGCSIGKTPKEKRCERTIGHFFYLVKKWTENKTDQQPSSVRLIYLQSLVPSKTRLFYIRSFPFSSFELVVKNKFWKNYLFGAGELVAFIWKNIRILHLAR